MNAHRGMTKSPLKPSMASVTGYNKSADKPRAPEKDVLKVGDKFKGMTIESVTDHFYVCVSPKGYRECFSK